MLTVGSQHIDLFFLDGEADFHAFGKDAVDLGFLNDLGLDAAGGCNEVMGVQARKTLSSIFALIPSPSGAITNSSGRTETWTSASFRYSGSTLSIGTL